MWFTESAWPPIFICIGAAVLLWAWWFSSGRGYALVGAAGMLVLCGVLYGVELLIVTEGERVERAVLDLTSAYQQRELERSLEFVSDDAPEIKNLIRTTMNFVTVQDDLRITDLWVDVNENQTEAVSHFRANATIEARPPTYRAPHPSRWELSWRREGGQWRVTRVTPLHIVTGEPDSLLDRFRMNGG